MRKFNLFNHSSGQEERQITTSCLSLYSDLPLTCPLQPLHKMLILCMLLFVFGGMNVWGAPTKCTSTSDLKAGDVYYISSASTYSASAVVMAKSTGGNNFPQSTFNGSPVELTLGGNSTNGWTFSYKDGSNTYYLDPTNTTGSNYLKRSESVTDYGKFTITFSSGEAIITSKGKSSRNVVRYNSANSCFSCYTNQQNDVYLYKKESGYSITYHCNGATSGCPSNASGQTKIPATLPTPSKTGCIFAGWYTNEGLTTAATAGATLSADANLYAKWTTNVTLNRNGVTETINDVAVGTDLDEIDGSGDQGGCSAWTFVGWSKTQRAVQNVSTEMTLVTEVDGPGPYYAVYQHSEGGNGSRTLNIADLASENSWGNGVRQSPITLAPVTMTSNTSGDNGKYYSTDNSWRFYSSTTPKGTVTISIEGGSVTSVVSTPSVTFTISNGVATHTVSSNTKFTKFVVNYSAIVNYYSTTASCCTPLAQVEGSANLSQWNAGVHIY